MSRARLSDRLDDHPVVLALLDHDDGPAALGLWTVCLAWAHTHRRRGKPRGFVPVATAQSFAREGTRTLASALVDCHLWERHPDGWIFTEIPDLFRWGATRNPGTWISRTARHCVYKRDGYRCRACGATDGLTLDHIRPRSRGGSDDETNLQTLCRSCNSSKGARI